MPILPVWVHPLFESLAYAAGFALYQRSRARSGDFLVTSQRNSLIVAAILGAAAGSKLLDWFQQPGLLLQNWHTTLLLAGGKTIVGGLLGGTIAVEWTKRRLDITSRTGDLFAVPIALAIAVGRIGCFLAGLSDHTYGVPTSLPWAVDFGDGVPRHPTQLYEIAFLLALIALLNTLSRMPHREGDLFRVFLFSYCLWRFLTDFLKPDPPIGPLSAIQWAALAAVVWYSRDILAIISLTRPRRAPQHG